MSSQLKQVLLKSLLTEIKALKDKTIKSKITKILSELSPLILDKPDTMQHALKELQTQMVGEFAKIHNTLSQLTTNTDPATISTAIEQALGSMTSFKTPQADTAGNSSSDDEDDASLNAMLKDMEEIPIASSDTPQHSFAPPIIKFKGAKRKLDFSDGDKPAKVPLLDEGNKSLMAFDIFTYNCADEFAASRNAFRKTTSQTVVASILGSGEAVTPSKEQISEWAAPKTTYREKYEEIKRRCDEINGGDPVRGARAALLSTMHRVGNV